MLNCNIDAKGKTIRLIYGLALLASGLTLATLWARPNGGWFAWSVALFVIVSGAFAIFEARAGWCVVRAMGFRTRF
jgi:hypothetical protein